MIKKLQSNKGATFIIALIYFLICMMVGASMITAAATDKGRVVATIEDEQTYFLVSSAATSFRDKLLNARFEDSFDVYNGGTGNKSAYEAAVASGDKGKFDLDEEGNAICPLPNERFKGEESINDPSLDITSIGTASQDGDDDFLLIYNAIARYARDIFYRETRFTSDASAYGYTPYLGHSFDAEMQLNDSTEPILVKFTMVEDGDDYARLDTYDIFIEFRNKTDPSVPSDKEYCVTLILKATRSADTIDSQLVNYKIKRNVTVSDGVTEVQEVVESIGIDTTPLNIKWDKATIKIGSVE